MDKLSNNLKINNLRFIDLFSLEEIQRIQELYAESTGLASQIIYPDGTPITSPCNFSRLCSEVICNSEKGLEHCRKTKAELSKNNNTGPIFCDCMNGCVRDASINIVVGGNLIASWLVGQVRIAKLDENKIAAYANEIGVDKNELLKAVEELPHMLEEQYNKVTNMLFVFTKELSDKAFSNLQLKIQLAEQKKLATILKQSEEKYRKLIEDSSDVIWTSDLDFTIRFVGSSIKKLVGYSVEEYNLLTMEEKFPSNSLAQLYSMRDQELEKEKDPYCDKSRTYSVDVEHFRSDGTSIWLAMHLSFIRDKHGKPIGIESVTSDISSKKKAEIALIKSQEKFHDLFEFAVDGILLGSPDGIITDANSCLCKMLGRKKEDVVGLHITKSFFTDESQNRIPFDFEAVKSGKVVISERDIIRPDGTIISTEMHTKMMPDKSYQGNIHDITERKKSESELIEVNKLLKLFMKYSPIYAFIKEVTPTKSLVLKASENFIDLVGIPGSEMEGKDMFDLFPAEFALKITADDWKVIEEGKEIKFEEELNGKFYTTIKFPISIDNKKILAGYSIDITETKRFEMEIEQNNIELEAINTEKDKFFSILSHDLRSPFNVFLGFTRILRDSLPSLNTDEIQNIAKTMHNSATNLYCLLENLLDWSRIQRGFANFQMQPFNLALRIEESIQFAKELAIKKNIHFETVVDEQIVINGDENMIASTIHNLTINAVKYTLKGGYVKLSAEINSRNEIQVSVKDTGIGMSQDMLQSLFLFENKIQRRGTNGEPSSGLGLIICKDFIEKHGGIIWAESEEGNLSAGKAGGSTFHFTIPTQ